MSSEDDTTLEVKGLDQLLKSLKAKPPTCRVGVLGDKDARTDAKSPSNATIGAAHEYGTVDMPQRSFLRVPLTDHLTKSIEQSGALDKDVLKEVIKQGTVIPWMLKIAKLAELIVAEAFDSDGFGKWAKWKNKNYTNQTSQILVDTQQLRNSITSEVKA